MHNAQHDRKKLDPRKGGEGEPRPLFLQKRIEKMQIAREGFEKWECRERQIRVFFMLH